MFLLTKHFFFLADNDKYLTTVSPWVMRGSDHWWICRTLKIRPLANSENMTYLQTLKTLESETLVCKSESNVNYLYTENIFGYCINGYL